MSFRVSILAHSGDLPGHFHVGQVGSDLKLMVGGEAGRFAELAEGESKVIHG